MVEGFTCSLQETFGGIVQLDAKIKKVNETQNELDEKLQVVDEKEKELNAKEEQLEEDRKKLQMENEHMSEVNKIHESRVKRWSSLHDLDLDPHQRPRLDVGGHVQRQTFRPARERRKLLH